MAYYAQEVKRDDGKKSSSGTGYNRGSSSGSSGGSAKKTWTDSQGVERVVGTNMEVNRETSTSGGSWGGSSGSSSSIYKVGSDGKAPKGLSIGDQVVTGGGTYTIKGYNPDGSYRSELSNSNQNTGNFSGSYGDREVLAGGPGNWASWGDGGEATGLYIYKGKGYGYYDKGGTYHVVGDEATAKEYAGPGGYQTVYTTYGGGYPVTIGGNGRVDQLIGYKDGTLKEGGTWDGSLPSLENLPQINTDGALNNGLSYQYMGGAGANIGLMGSTNPYYAEIDRARREGMDYLNEITDRYDVQKDNIISALDAYMKQGTDQLNSQKTDIEEQAEQSARQAYLSSLQQQYALPELLAAQGIRGGGTESAYLDLMNAYQGQRGSINQGKTEALRGVDNAIVDLTNQAEIEKMNQLIANNQAALQAYQSAYGDTRNYLSSLYGDAVGYDQWSRELAWQQQQAALENQKYQEQLEYTRQQNELSNTIGMAEMGLISPAEMASRLSSLGVSGEAAQAYYNSIQAQRAAETRKAMGYGSDSGRSGVIRANAPLDTPKEQPLVQNAMQTLDAIYNNASTGDAFWNTVRSMGISDDIADMYLRYKPFYEFGSGPV